MAPSDRQKAFRQRFYLYMMLTKPNQKLYITMPRVDSEGKGSNPSYLVDSLKELFPGLSLKEIESFSADDRILSKKSALDYLTELINKAASFGFEALNEEELKDFSNLIDWAKAEESDTLNMLLKGSFYRHEKESFSENIMLAVNEAMNSDETISGSISKFELYNECSYKYFLTYILQLREREEFQLSSIDMGNFYHEALERYSKNLKADNKSFKSVTEEERERYLEAAISQTFESMAKVSTLEDSTQRYIVEKMKETVRAVVDIITIQVSRGEFEPELFEEEIVSKIVDKDSAEVVATLKGKVDRIDLTDTDDKAVRIIDYKSSGHKLDLNECYHGLSIQLPIYMGVVLDKLKDKYPSVAVHPSAMLYYDMKDKYLKANPMGGFTEEERLKLSRMEGLLSSEPEDLEANDATVGIGDGQTQKSSIVPYEVKKDGDLGSGTNAVSKTEMHTVIDYSMLKAAETAKSILEGQFEPSPAKLGSDIDACRYCSYRSICHFNENEAGFETRVLEKAGKNADVLEKMKEDLGEQ
jgi:ATP-dependent helicase/nuclease subunit B